MTSIIRGVTGRNPGAQFDVATLEGAKARLTIEYSEPDAEGSIFANIVKYARRNANAPANAPFKNAHGLVVSDADVTLPGDDDDTAPGEEESPFSDA